MQWQTCLECQEQFQGMRCECGWQPGGTKSPMVFRNTEHPQPANCITKDEFGIGIYNTISLIGGIIQIRQYLGKVAMGEMEPGDYKQREGKLIEQFRTALLALKPDEVTQVVRRYPWVAAL